MSGFRYDPPIEALVRSLGLDDRRVEDLAVVLSKRDEALEDHLSVSLPQGAVGRASVSASQVGITAEAALAGLAASPSLASPRRVRVSAMFRVLGTVAGDTARLRIKDGAAVLRTSDHYIPSTSTGFNFVAEVEVDAAAGPHAYALTLQRVFGTGSLTLEATTGNRVSLLVEDLGPA